MSLIAAIEPDRRQAAQLSALGRGPLRGVQLVVADSTERVIAALGGRVPDLILVSALISPKDEHALAERLRELDAAAAHVQTLTIPVLAAPRRKKSDGVLSRLRRQRTTTAAPDGCDPHVFAEQVAEYLKHGAAERERAADDARFNEEHRATAPAPPPIPIAPPPQAPTLAFTREPASIFVEPEPIRLEPAPTVFEPEPTVFEEPATFAAEPAVSVEEPATSVEEPVVFAAEPVAFAPEPIAILPEPDPIVAAPPSAPIAEPRWASFEVEPEPESVVNESEWVSIAIEPEPDPIVAEPEWASISVESDAEPIAIEPEWASIALELEAESLAEECEPEPESTPDSDLWMALPLDVHRAWPRLDGPFIKPIRVASTPEPMFVMQQEAPEPGPNTTAAPSSSATLEPARPEWIELLDALRQDLDRIQTARVVRGAKPAGGPAARTGASDGSDETGDAASAAGKKKTKKGQPVQDEWGFFDPDQCGFAALVAKLDEVADPNDKTPVKRPA
jgi:hypothetical protein